MTAILNKLVSACQTIEANAGSGGGGGSSEPAYATSVATLNKSSFDIFSCYIPFAAVSEQHAEAKIYIKVNDEGFDRYYIEVVVDTTIEPHFCYKVFKNTSASSDSTALTFGLTKCSCSGLDENMYCLSINGINSITSDTFTVYNQHTYKGHLAGDGDSGITIVSEVSPPQTRFVSVGP